MARPECWDLLSNEKLDIHDDFVEHLTHRAYFIQTLQIKQSFNTRLEKLLSVFEQKNFIGDDKTTKSFSFEADDTEIKEVLNVLQYVAADEKTREELDRENYYQEALEGMFGEQNRKFEKQKKEFEEAKKELEENKKTIEELQREKIKTAKNFKNIGIPVEQIAQATGLTVQEVEAL
jgi:predicted RNase H-like nuclease (RuvC/YqgF family)